MILLITYYNLRKLAIVSFNLFRSSENDNLYIPKVNVPAFWDGPKNEMVDTPCNILK